MYKMWFSLRRYMPRQQKQQQQPRPIQSTPSLRDNPNLMQVFRYVYKWRCISMIKIFPHFPSSDDMPSVPLILTILISKNAFSGVYCKSQVKTRRSVVFSMVLFGKFNKSSSIVTCWKASLLHGLSESFIILLNLVYLDVSNCFRS